MKKILLPAAGFCLIVCYSSCVSLLPVNNQYEKAGSLEKGNIELSGHVTRYDVSHYNRTETSNRNFGFRAGYGISDRFDLKLRYEKMMFTKNFDDKLRRSDYISLVPKFAIVPRYFSILLPISTYYLHSEADGYKWNRHVRSIAPQFIFSITNRSEKIDLSLSAKMDYLWEVNGDHDHNVFFGATMGAGFSTNLKKWAIRPEIGFATDDMESKYISYGIGLQWIIPTKRK